MYNRPAQSCSLGPQLVVPVLSDVPHPGQRLVAGLLYDLQVSHLDTRRREVRDLKLHVDGRLSLDQVAVNTGQKELSLHEIFLPPRK